jgi:glucose-6-phosphate 1-dehydrogenase
MTGDATLYQRADTVEIAWGVVQPILDAWKFGSTQDFPNYEAGSWGPKEAEELMTKEGRNRSWCNE